MGACRESYSIKINPKATFRWRTWKYGYSRKLWFEDNFMPTFCKLFGHKKYQPDEMNEPNEWACKRCHRFITNP